jgi:hypothetical protein
MSAGRGKAGPLARKRKLVTKIQRQPLAPFQSSLSLRRCDRRKARNTRAFGIRI